MKIPKNAYNEKQLEALAKNDVIFDFDKDYSDDGIADIEKKIGDIIMDNVCYFDGFSDNKRDFWKSLMIYL